MLESKSSALNQLGERGINLVEPQGFEPRSRPYEWNELVAVSYPCQDHFLRVLPLHQGSEKLAQNISVFISVQVATSKHKLDKIGGKYWNRTNQFDFAAYILKQNTVLHHGAYFP